MVTTTVKVNKLNVKLSRLFHPIALPQPPLEPQPWNHRILWAGKPSQTKPSFYPFREPGTSFSLETAQTGDVFEQFEMNPWELFPNACPSAMAGSLLWDGTSQAGSATAFVTAQGSAQTSLAHIATEIPINFSSHQSNCN